MAEEIAELRRFTMSGIEQIAEDVRTEVAITQEVSRRRRYC